MPETPVLTPVPGARERLDDDGNPIVEVATCGTCGRSWNDAAISSVTPVPAGRCPFEYEHEDNDPAEPLPSRLNALAADIEDVMLRVEGPDADTLAQVANELASIAHEHS